MKKIKILKIILSCFAVLILGIIIMLIGKLRADQAALESKAENPTPFVASADETSEEPTNGPTNEPTMEPVETVAPTKVPEVTVAAAVEDEAGFAPTEDNIFVTADNVNLRAQPESTAEIIAEVRKSTLLKRTGLAAEWSRVVYNSQVCYVSNELITDKLPEIATSGVDDPGSARASSGGKIIIIDPGHQSQGDNTQEPIGPGASTTKARVTSGTTGSVSGWAEYQLNLAVSLQLRDELVRRRYTVYMTREIHEVSMSNKERAEFATAKGGDILVRIHANGSENSSVNGALCMAPTSSNSFLSASLISESQKLSQCIIDNYVAATGFGNQGVYPTDEMSGINWSTMPVTIVEMGYMSNASDDAKMADSAMQVKMVKGMCDGIDSYFAGSTS